MDLTEYQKLAQETDQNDTGENAVIIPLLGLAGETGTLLSSYKKWLRDGEAHRLFKNKVIEDLGDILWYLANVATKLEVDLSAVARSNLAKLADRFGTSESSQRLFDDRFSREEQLPRAFVVSFRNEKREDKMETLRIYRDGVQVGDFLTDNSYLQDGYRYHDAFHFAYATMLGWSPVSRHVLRCKRKSDTVVDNVEDGGRARVFEESIAALAFQRGKEHEFFANVGTIDFDILATIKSLVSQQEVSIRTARDWERAILEGFRIWRLLTANDGGTVAYDLLQRTMHFSKNAEP